MSTQEERREDAKREAFDDSLAQCPGCDHASLVITQSLSATRIDPSCWSGYCECKRRNREIAEGLIPCPECGPNVSDMHTGLCQGCGAYIHYQGKPDHAVLNLFERVPSRCGPISPPTETCECSCHCNCELQA